MCGKALLTGKLRQRESTLALRLSLKASEKG
jgi:hypothetical protein